MADGSCGSPIGQSPARCPVCRAALGEQHARYCRNGPSISDAAAERIARQHERHTLREAVADEHF